MELYTIEEVARVLDVHPRTVRRYIEKGELRGERVGGSWRVSEDALKEMFDAPEMKEAVMGRMQQRAEDMTDLYLQGRHRLQQEGSPVMVTLVLDAGKKPWVMTRYEEWMKELNRLGENAPFDFTMVCDKESLFRWTLIATMDMAQAMIKELERLHTVSEQGI